MTQKFSQKKHSLFKAALPIIILISGLLTVLTIPDTVKASVPKVDTVFPKRIEYTPSVTCSGTIEYDSLHSITCNVPLVIKKYRVYEGGRIDEGQIIAEIDKEKTISALTGVYGTAGLDSGKVTQAVKDLPDFIEADRSGAVFSVANEGELINAGDSIAKIGDKGSLVMKAYVSERDISKVGAGQQVTVAATAADKEYSGMVSSISSCARKIRSGANEETVVDVTIEIKNPTDELKSGFSAQGSIKTGLTCELVTLPYSAICQDDRGEYVYVFSGGSAVRRDIKTGLELSDGTGITGVDTNEEVILSPGGIRADMPVMRNL